MQSWSCEAWNLNLIPRFWLHHRNAYPRAVPLSEWDRPRLLQKLSGIVQGIRRGRPGRGPWWCHSAYKEMRRAWPSLCDNQYLHKETELLVPREVDDCHLKGGVESCCAGGNPGEHLGKFGHWNLHELVGVCLRLLFTLFHVKGSSQTIYTTCLALKSKPRHCL